MLEFTTDGWAGWDGVERMGYYIVIMTDELDGGLGNLCIGRMDGLGSRNISGYFFPFCCYLLLLGLVDGGLF